MNVGIIGANPGNMLSIAVKGDLLDWPEVDPNPLVICCLKSMMTEDAFYKFLRENHINVLLVSQKFRFPSKEDFDGTRFSKEMENIAIIIW